MELGAGPGVPAPLAIGRERATPAPDDALRARIAAATHLAVCGLTGSAGFGHCHLYAVAGIELMSAAGLSGYQLQAGSLRIQPDAARPEAWFAFEAGGGGLERGEFHAWIASEEGILIDLAARHYRRYVEETAIPARPIDELAPGAIRLGHAGRPSWKRGDPPESIWDRFADVPQWLAFHSLVEAQAALYRRIREDPIAMGTLCRLARGHFERLSA